MTRPRRRSRTSKKLRIASDPGASTYRRRSESTSQHRGDRGSTSRRVRGGTTRGNAARTSTFRRPKRGMSWNELVDRIENDETFRITSVDGRHWLEPFTGKRIRITGDLVSQVQDHYRDHDYWRKLPLKAFPELCYWRWLHHLQEVIRNEPRLRFFRGDGQWLNPYDGKWYDGIRRVENRVTSMTLHEMAKAVSMTNENRDPEMMDFNLLRQIIEEGRAKTTKEKAAPAEAKSADAKAASEADGDEYEATADVGAGAADPESEVAAVADTGKPTEEDEEEAVQTMIQRRREGKVDLDEDDEEEGSGEAEPKTSRARKVQRHLLGDLPQIDGYRLAVEFRPHSQVSGDFYEFVELDDDRGLMVVGDVTGHGVQAALTMATVLKSLRIVCRDAVDVSDIAIRLNQEVTPDLMPEQFFTLYLGLLEYESRVLTSLCLGHQPALVLNREAESILSRTGSRSSAVGLLKGSMFEKTLKPITRRLEPGDLVLQYTDGVDEAMSPDDVEYGPGRVMGSVVRHLMDEEEPPLEKLIESMLDDVDDWAAGNVEDDITVMALKVDGEG